MVWELCFAGRLADAYRRRLLASVRTHQESAYTRRYRCRPDYSARTAGPWQWCARRRARPAQAYAVLTDCDDALLGGPRACKLAWPCHDLVDLHRHGALVGGRYTRHAGAPSNCAQPCPARIPVLGTQSEYHLVAGRHYYG